MNPVKSSDATWSFGIAAEDAGAYRAATTLGDRKLTETVDWVDHSTLNYYRRWTGLEESEDYFPKDKVKARALGRHGARSRRFSPRVRGRFDGSPFTTTVRKALVLFNDQGPEVDLVVVAFDTEGQEGAPPADCGLARYLEDLDRAFVALARQPAGGSPG